MTRVRTDNVFGTTTDNPLTAGATTINSAGLANLAAVSGADRAVIVLDPNRVNGAPEIVNVSAHTGSATSATIVRARFGTTAREHPAGTEWVHGPIAGNPAESLAAGVTGQGDFVPAGAWESWTPTLANLTLGSGTVTAAFTRIGRTIHFRFSFTLGSGSAVGSNPTFTLPVEASAGFAANRESLGDVFLRDTGTATYAGFAILSSSTVCGVFVSQASGTYSAVAAITSTVPHTWASTDIITVVGTYEAVV